ncbi:hypothetical protein [Paractinoplanes atraurantiacus]|uniref:Uncharacterized protein n=1 Tax=Paractinoplanes atraurantiacus TaxID=1036182 RepID=A0A285K242_9ACTN|nr:hypothetical protein [Actinoplanes atraurantiacus]SNY66649.1 hypothetical protein SAMN05421748_13087 [Actinoplanes atraurantiacus]
MRDEDVAENLIDRLLQALAAQVAATPGHVLAAGAVEALEDLSRAESERLFGQAGHLVHYGTDMEPLEALIGEITAVQRREAPEGAVLKPGDAVRLVGELPDSLAGYAETVFVVRYVSRAPTIVIQSDLAEDYVVVTVPATAVELVR